MNLRRTNVLFAVRFSRNRANTYRPTNAAARSKDCGRAPARASARKSGKNSSPDSEIGRRQSRNRSLFRTACPGTENCCGAGCTGHYCCTALLHFVSIVGLKIGNGAAVQDRLHLNTLQYIKPTATCGPCDNKCSRGQRVLRRNQLSSVISSLNCHKVLLTDSQTLLFV